MHYTVAVCSETMGPQPGHPPERCHACHVAVQLPLPGWDERGALQRTSTVLRLEGETDEGIWETGTLDYQGLDLFQIVVPVCAVASQVPVNSQVTLSACKPLNRFSQKRDLPAEVGQHVRSHKWTCCPPSAGGSFLWLKLLTGKGLQTWGRWLCLPTCDSGR